MSIPLWALLGFAGWTVMLLLGTVGIYRWSRILTGRVPMSAFRADQVEGEDWYKRSMRAHANCIENLPVFGAIVFVLHVSGTVGSMIDALCIIVLVTRILQSLIHVCFAATNTMVGIRFAFFLPQLICFLILIVMIIQQQG